MITRSTFRHRIAPTNAGSMADIAFLLLVFFLVTTTLDLGLGITRMLAPFSNAPAAPVASRNILNIQVNDAGALLVNERPADLRELRTLAMEFMTNPEDRNDLPTISTITEAECQERLRALGGGSQHAVWQQRLEAAQIIGPYREPPADAQILITPAGATPYSVYIAVQDELEGAVRILRDERSMRSFAKPFTELDEHDPVDRARIQAIRRAFPLRVGDGELVRVDARP